MRVKHFPVVSAAETEMTSFAHRFGIVFGLTAVGYLLSFCSQLLISAYFGTSQTLDAYWAGLAVVNLLCFYANPLREVLIPAMHRGNKDERDEVDRVLSAGLSLFVIAAGIASVVLVVFSDAFVTMMTGSAGDTRDTLSRLIPWLLPYLWLFTIAETLNTFLISFGRAALQACSRILASFVLIAVIATAGTRMGIPALVLAQVASLVVVGGLSFIALRRMGFRIVRHRIGVLRGKGIYPRFGALLGAQFLAHIYVVGERWAMIHASIGLVSAFQYSTALVNVLYTLIAVPVSNLLWSRFLGSYQCGEKAEAGRLAAHGALGIFTLLMLICIFAWLRAQDIVYLLFSRGAFDEASVALTTETLRATIFTAIPFGLGTIFSRFLMSFNQARRQAWVSITTTIAGMTVIMLALGFDHRAVIWHWLAANLVGAAVSGWYYIRETTFTRAQWLQAVRWVVLSGLSAVLAAMLTPTVNFGGGKFGLAMSLAFSGIVYLSAAMALGWCLRLHKPLIRLLRGA